MMRGLCAAVVFALLIANGAIAKPAETKPKATEDYPEYLGDAYDDEGTQNDDNQVLPDYVNNVEPGITDSEEKDDKQGEKEKLPVVLTTPKSYVVKPGDSLVLDCEVQDLGSYVLMWQNESGILFQDGIKFNNDNNLKLLTNNSLMINDVTNLPNSSIFKCSVLVSNSNTLSVSHTIKKLKEPKILSFIAKNNQTNLKQGDTLELTCVAEGSPTPEISWHFEHGSHSERLTATGNVLTIPKITHRQAGHYRCLADNHNGNPAHAYIVITVQHKPHMIIDQMMVNAITGLSIELKCTVFANPKSQSIWQRNGRNMHNSDHTTVHSDGNHLILTIKNVTEDDFDTYTCVASNFLGKTTKDTKLVKTPVILQFLKPQMNTREAVLTWTADSKIPITESELHYEKVGDTKWNIVKAEIIDSKDNVYRLKHTIHNLGPGKYEAKVRTMNAHGWSDFSGIELFEGTVASSGSHKHNKQHNNSKAHHHNKADAHKNTEMNDSQVGDNTLYNTSAPPQQPKLKENTPMKETQVAGSASDGVCKSSTTMILISIISLAVYWVRQ